MPVPPVSFDQPAVPSVPARRSPAGSNRVGRARVAMLVLVVTLAGSACGQSDETVSPDIRLSRVVTGQGVDALPIDRTAGSDPAAVRADGAPPAAPAAALGGVTASPSPAAPSAAAPPTVAPPAASTVAPAPVGAPASPPAPTTTSTPTTVAPAAVAPSPGAGSAPATPLPTVAVSVGSSPAPTATTALAPPGTAAEADLVTGEERSFTLLNELRGGMSLAPLTRDPALDTLAREWSRHMAESGDLTHSENPYGENIAFTSNSALTAAEAAQVFERLWSEDPAHSQNMMGAYVKVGVGVFRSDHGWYGTHLFNY